MTKSMMKIAAAFLLSLALTACAQQSKPTHLDRKETPTELLAGVKKTVRTITVKTGAGSISRPLPAGNYQMAIAGKGTLTVRSKSGEMIMKIGNAANQIAEAEQEITAGDTIELTPKMVGEFTPTK